jgi:hypothetical protein
MSIVKMPKLYMPTVNVGPRTQLAAKRLSQVISLIRLLAVLKAVLAAYRHVRARSVVGTATEAYTWISGVRPASLNQ